MYRVILGAAHTLMQPGEIFQDLREADLTRKILAKAIPHLEKSGLEFKTVPLDLPLLQRIEWINNTGFKQEEGDIFIEIHVNDGGKRGIENWFSERASEDNPSQKLAEFLINDMTATLKFEKQGAKSEYEHELTSLLILNQTKTISIATELLYIDNPEDIKLLKDESKLDELAKTLVDSVKKYFEDAKKRPLPKAKETSSRFPSIGGAGAPGGLPSFNPAFPNFGANPAAPATSTSGNSTLLMDREQRKQMIIDTYKKIIGEEPKQNELNNYLNLALSENDLVSKLATSPEHEAIVKDAKDAKELRDKTQTLENENIKLKSELNDLRGMHQNLQRLLAFKNQAIMQMQNELVNRNVIKKGEYYDPSKQK